MKFLPNLFTLERDSNYYIGQKLIPLKIKKNDIRILRLINTDQSISPQELCTSLMEDKVTVAKSIKKMEALGYIAKDIDPSDKRRANLTLTSKGASVRQQVRAILGDLNEMAMMDLSPEERVLAESLIEKIALTVHDRTKRLG